MRRTLFGTAVLTAMAAATVFGQEGTSGSRNNAPSFGQRLSRFGRNLFGADEEPEPTSHPTHARAKAPSSSYSTKAGQPMMQKSSTKPGSTAFNPFSRSEDEESVDRSSTMISDAADGRTGSAGSSRRPGTIGPGRLVEQDLGNDTAAAARPTKPTASSTPPSSGTKSSGSTTTSKAVTRPTTSVGSESAGTPRPNTSRNYTGSTTTPSSRVGHAETTAPTKTLSKTASEPSTSSRTSSNHSSTAGTPSKSRGFEASEAKQPSRIKEPPYSVASSMPRELVPIDDAPSANGSSPIATSTAKELSRASEPVPSKVSEPARDFATPVREPSTVTPQVDDRIILSRNSPNLSVETSGPRRITVGKEAEYTVFLKNSGEMPATDVVVYVSIPSWAEVVDARATNGTATTAGGDASYQWKMVALPPQSHQELALKIVPRKSMPFDLTVRCTYAPPTTQATVEVEEPKVQMSISGPTEVVYGQRQLYKLSISNPGTGDAEDVMIHLLPITPGDGTTASHRVGTLKAGASTAVEIELTARQAGKVSIHANATADGGLKSDASIDVMVRRAGLQVTAAAPKMHYAGAAMTCEVRVKNPGDAPASKVAISAVLPAGAELISASHNGHNLVRNDEVAWTLDQLAAGSEQVLSFKYKIKTPGAAKVEAMAIAEGDLKSSSVANTEIMAVADLVLEVVDSAGPVPVGEEMVYTIQMRNRGTSAADDVSVIAYFSQGVEPVGIEGGRYELGNGSVQFKPMSLAAGSEVQYKVKARGSNAGHHQLRVELQCQPLGTRLTQELTTLFYSDEQVATKPSTTGTR
ncbi:MAG TPA: CARDB domain-containing protein [Pirellulales bacterium]|nr:CARDB domain-containing protein [Pirellulales bacterium]